MPIEALPITGGIYYANVNFSPLRELGERELFS